MSHPEIFKDQLVLELGSGTGLVGLVAALAGAQQVRSQGHRTALLWGHSRCTTSMQAVKKQHWMQVDHASRNSVPQTHVTRDMYNCSVDISLCCCCQLAGVKRIIPSATCSGEGRFFHTVLMTHKSVAAVPSAYDCCWWLQVVLSDYEDQVLINLRTCMHMNTRAVAAQAAEQQQQAPDDSIEAVNAGTQSHALNELFGASTDEDEAAAQQQHQSAHDVTDKELFEDAESVEDFDLSTMMEAGTSSGGAASDPAGVAAEIAVQQLAWEAENMCVRHLDWQESADALQTSAPAGQPAATGAEPSGSSSRAITGASPVCDSSTAPGVPLDQQYPVILGNEVMYELQHAQLVAAAIRHRLQPGGRALLCCAVRDQKVFDTFRDSCRQWGLRYRALGVRPERDEDLGGIQGRERDYEGGYLLMAVDHAAAPASDWHRDDFQLVM